MSEPEYSQCPNCAKYEKQFDTAVKGCFDAVEAIAKDKVAYADEIKHLRQLCGQAAVVICEAVDGGSWLHLNRFQQAGLDNLKTVLARLQAAAKGEQ